MCIESDCVVLTSEKFPDRSQSRTFASTNNMDVRFFIKSLNSFFSKLWQSIARMWKKPNNQTVVNLDAVRTILSTIRTLQHTCTTRALPWHEVRVSSNSILTALRAFHWAEILKEDPTEHDPQHIQTWRQSVEYSKKYTFLKNEENPRQLEVSWT